ncbi:MAG TPA: hypothetical protein VG985_00575 [Xanthobacteraceae bacterium]|nr:hypothetical protein [Xanthobacteraceae bacterium]
MTTGTIGKRAERSTGGDLGPADWVCLAAAPAFAVMALVSACVGGQQDMFCTVAQGASPLNGMAFMYMLMSACHSAPWLRLISGRKS